MAWMRAQKEQRGCWVRECVWCCSLIDVTVWVSPLQEPSSLTHCPRTHITCSVSHCLLHTHKHTHHQWLPFASLLSSSPPSSFATPLFTHPSFFYTSITTVSQRPINCDDRIVFALLPKLTKYQWLLSKQHCVMKYSKVWLLSHHNYYLLKETMRKDLWKD